ncbi:hypothetical protein [Psychrobacter sp. I-STPA6b]|uniref:hypothetical protein n=1 Tax=Psychrobacter sp. I-STPA6b TaxID=2585718 RepID=UPI001D0C4283|nr:hypothetical protein [Psychrobacter sp. I-STPA6b]
MTNSIMRITEKTLPFRALSIYALPYIAIILIRLWLENLGYLNALTGGLLALLVMVFISSVLVVYLFKARHHRALEKIECSRIGIITTTVGLITILIYLSIFFNSVGLDWRVLTDLGIGMNIMLFIGVVFSLIIQYAVVFYGLWHTQQWLLKR